MRVWQHNTPHTTAICGPLSSVQPHSLCRSYYDMGNTAGTRRPGLAGRVVWENSNNDQDQAGRGPGTGRGSSQQGADVTLISGDFLQYLLIFHLVDHTHADIPDANFCSATPRQLLYKLRTLPSPRWFQVHNSNTNTERANTVLATPYCRVCRVCRVLQFWHQCINIEVHIV